MKKLMFLFFIILNACESVSSSKQSIPPSLISTSTGYSVNLPPKWTITPTPSSSRGKEFVPSTIITPFINMTATPTLTMATSITTPTNAIMPITSVTTPFITGLDTFITFVCIDTICAANWEGKTTQLLLPGQIDLYISSDDVIHMEISPDRKYLAFSGINVNDGRLELELLSLDSLIVIDREIFEGTQISDFTWSPDSNSLLAVVLTLRTGQEFDTTIYRLDLGKHVTRNTVFTEKNLAISQIKWLLPEKASYLDFSCQNAVSVELEAGYPIIYGRTGVGVLNLQDNSSHQKYIADTLYYGWSHIELSPDGSEMIFLGIIPEKGGIAENKLFSAQNLISLSCPFCHNYGDLIWAKGFFLADGSEGGQPNGTIYLLDENGGSRKLLDYTNPGPNSRIYVARGITAWIDDESASIGEPRIKVTDLQACLPGDANINSCMREMWTIEGQWPDGYNEQNSLDISCSQ